jgi:hypothetical protein
VFVDLKNILKYIQQDATLHSLFYLETASHISGGTTSHHQERKQLYLQHLVFVTPLLLSAAIAAGRPDQQHYYHHAPKVKPEVATAVVELLMRGVRTPKTC